MAILRALNYKLYWLYVLLKAAECGRGVLFFISLIHRKQKNYVCWIETGGPEFRQWLHEGKGRGSMKNCRSNDVFPYC